jgi:hypothetical protein
MSFYENQSAMFMARAEKCKRDGDYHYAQAMTAKEAGNQETYRMHMAQAQTQYRMQKDNERKVKENIGKSWR